MRISQVNKRIDRQITRTNGTPCENDDRVIKMSFSIFREALGSDFIIARQRKLALCFSFPFRASETPVCYCNDCNPLIFPLSLSLALLATFNSRPGSSRRSARSCLIAPVFHLALSLVGPRVYIQTRCQIEIEQAYPSNL